MCCQLGLWGVCVCVWMCTTVLIHDVLVFYSCLVAVCMAECLHARETI